MKYYTLYQLNKSVQKLINGINKEFWITAEISQARIGYHAYLDLVQKEGESVVAKSRANIWNIYLKGLKHKLGESFDQLMQAGTKVMLKVNVTFHEVYGLSLAVTDIDPAYTMGELELQRQETIKRLEKEELMDAQKQLSLPRVVQRIAVLTSPDAAGYTDFLNQLERNEYGYRFALQLFPAAVQGPRSVSELIAQLQRVPPRAFDAIVLIRGGGARLDLQAFDEYELAAKVAQCSLPIITGIGHQRDTSVCDMVSYLALKTPTAVAEHLIQRCLQFEAELEQLVENIRQLSKQECQWARESLKELQYRLQQAMRQRIKEEQMGLANMEWRIAGQAERQVERQRELLGQLEKRLRLVDPQRLLERGYVMAFQEGKPLSATNKLDKGDELQLKTAIQQVRVTVNQAE